MSAKSIRERREYKKKKKRRHIKSAAEVPKHLESRSFGGGGY